MHPFGRQGTGARERLRAFAFMCRAVWVLYHHFVCFVSSCVCLAERRETVKLHEREREEEPAHCMLLSSTGRESGLCLGGSKSTGMRDGSG